MRKMLASNLFLGVLRRRLIYRCCYWSIDNQFCIRLIIITRFLQIYTFLTVSVSCDDHLLILITWICSTLILILLKSLHPFKSDVFRGEELIVLFVLCMTIIGVSVEFRCWVCVFYFIHHIVCWYWLSAIHLIVNLQLFQIYLFIICAHFLLMCFTWLNLLLLVAACTTWSITSVIVALF